MVDTNAEAVRKTRLSSRGGGRKSKSTDSVSEDGRTPIRRSKSFKRIRGLLSGESRRERKERKAKEKAASSQAASSPASTESPSSRSRGDPTPARDSSDDEETVYDVDVEERSVASSRPRSVASNSVGTPSPTRRKKAQQNLLGPAKTEESAMEDHEAFFSSPDFKKPYLLKVVLLLMDPETRRFELLQLEFDSLKALVSDVLAQITVSVTEDALRQQTYTGICGFAGKEMTPEQLLATFCHGNDVLVAIPVGVNAKECTRLAKPILGDEKVGAMLLSSGIDARAWRDESKPKKKKRSEKKSKAEVNNVRAQEKAPSPVHVFVSVALLAILLQVFHLYSSAPIRPGHVVSPGIWLSKCGILAFWPGCDNQYLKMSDTGVATLYNAKQEIAWQMEGRKCPVNEDDCIAGMHVNLDGSLAIGGKPINRVTMYKESDLSPWPFAEAPKVKVWKK